jgi:acetyltransferase-like isoleucine patch superfamily enzyme
MTSNKSNFTNMNIIRMFLRNLNLFTFQSLFLNLFLKGKRSKKSLIILQGKVGFHYEKTSKINCKDGFLYINKSMRTKEPFSGAIELNDNSEINVENTFSIHSGCHIILLDNAKLNLGSGYINRNLRIRCYKEISIGNNVAISENVTIWDSDAHAIIGKEDQMTQSISIGNNVWIGNNVTILKGVTIGDGAIVAAGSVVNKNIPKACLAAGVPAKVIRENVNWK